MFGIACLNLLNDISVKNKQKLLMLSVEEEHSGKGLDLTEVTLWHNSITTANVVTVSCLRDCGHDDAVS